MIYLCLKKKKKGRGGFPGGPVVKNPPADAGEEDSTPGPGTKTPHAWAAKPITTTTESQAP